MNLEDEKSWSFFMPQVKLSLLAGILLQQPPDAGGTHGIICIHIDM